MPDSDLQDIVEIKELVSYENVNRYLGTGWVLISNHVHDYGGPSEKCEKTVYCLGCPKENVDIEGNAIHPETSSRGEYDTLL